MEESFQDTDKSLALSGEAIVSQTNEETAFSLIDRTLDRLASCNDSEFPITVPAFCEALMAVSNIESDPSKENNLRYLISCAAKTNARLIAACLLRLLAYNKSVLSRLDVRFDTLKLLDEVYGKEFYGQLSISIKTQTHEKEAALEQAVEEAEAELTDALSNWRGIDTLGEFRRHFQKTMNSSLVKNVIWPFFPKPLCRVRIDEVFGAVHEYLSAQGTGKAEIYYKVKGILDNYRVDAIAHGSQYTRRFLVSLIDRLSPALAENFASDPASKPADVTVSATEKKYPLHTPNNDFRVALTVRNAGPGQAFDVECTVTDIAGAEIEKREVFLGPLDTQPVLVEIPARVTAAISSILAAVEITWTNFDGTKGQYSETFEFAGQRADIAWDALAYSDPYHLEPVETEDELVGRREILESLVAKALGRTTGSSYVYGQKRVGKTSIVKTFQSRLAMIRPSCHIIYLEGGDYVHQNAVVTIENLGLRLCKEVAQKAPCLRSLPIPTFEGALSPLGDFLNDVNRAAPDLRFVFILDEFDELPMELYQRTPVGDAFFVTLRSISGKDAFGFILVGGEKMGVIVNYQGDRLNRFHATQLSYFDKETHWADFQDLVRRPVASWLEISDQALNLIYAQAAGNPYFTRLICRELVSSMVRNRDSHVTDREVSEAVKITLRAVESNSFQHFWQDGILDTQARTEQTSMNRRRVLLALADLLRLGVKPSHDAVLQRAKAYDMGGQETEQTLRSFVQRNVLTFEDEEYGFKVPLFGTWMKERGIREVITTFSDPDLALIRRQQEEDARVRSEEIVRVTERWGLYKGQRVSEERVRAWLSLFGDNLSQRLMFRILQHLIFYSADQIRAKMHEAHGIVVRGTTRRISQGKLKRDDILVSYLDGAGKSGSYYAKLYASENSIYAGNVVERGKLAETIGVHSDKLALVFVDDLLGTGQSACEYFNKLNSECGDLIRASGMRVFLIAITGFREAHEKIEKELARLDLPVDIYTCDQLTEADRCFGTKSRSFPNEKEREEAKNVAFSKGVEIEKKAPLGFGDCETAVIFESSCPNNNLPILWKETDSWIPLFKRM